MNWLFSRLDYLLYCIPVAFLSLYFREWFLNNFIAVKYSSEKRHIQIDILAFVSLSLFNISWGNAIQKNRRNNGFTFIIQQLASLILVVLSFVYIYMNQLKNTQWTYFLFHTLFIQNSILFIVNCIPIPPFDLSYIFYRSNMTQYITGFIKLLIIYIFYNITLFYPIHISWF